MNKPRTIDWYFDFISPFAYFAWQRLGEFRQHAVVAHRPILFAGVLAHHGQKDAPSFQQLPAWRAFKRNCDSSDRAFSNFLWLRYALPCSLHLL